MSGLVFWDMEPPLSCTSWASQALWLGTELFYGKLLSKYGKSLYTLQHHKTWSLWPWIQPHCTEEMVGCPWELHPSSNTQLNIPASPLGQTAVYVSPQDTAFSTEGPGDKDHLLKALLTLCPYFSSLISLPVKFQKDSYLLLQNSSG